MLAGLLLAAWVIDAFLVFKIWPNRMQPLEVAIATTAAAVEGPYGIPFLRAQGLDWATGLYHALFVASAIEQLITANPHALTPFDQTVQRFFVVDVACSAGGHAGDQALWLTPGPVAVGHPADFTGLLDGHDRWPGRALDPPLFRGRESATLYHRAKYAIAGAVGLWLFAYVCLPMPFELQLGSWVTAVVIGVLSRLQWKYYKKYV